MNCGMVLKSWQSLKYLWNFLQLMGNLHIFRLIRRLLLCVKEILWLFFNVTVAGFYFDKVEHGWFLIIIMRERGYIKINYICTIPPTTSYKFLYDYKPSLTPVIGNIFLSANSKTMNLTWISVISYIDGGFKFGFVSSFRRPR